MIIIISLSFNSNSTIIHENQSINQWFDTYSIKNNQWIN